MYLSVGCVVVSSQPNIPQTSTSARLTQDGRQMEASYATELQWVGQDKMDIL